MPFSKKQLYSTLNSHLNVATGFQEQREDPPKRKSGEAMDRWSDTKTSVDLFWAADAVQAGVGAVAETASFWWLTRDHPRQGEGAGPQGEGQWDMHTPGSRFGISGMPLLCNFHP